jgi:putative ATPase
MVEKNSDMQQEPLAERLRPRDLSSYVGQSHLVAKGKVLYNVIVQKQLHSFILWGPPGTGKTTLAQIIANALNYQFFSLSAINSGVKDLRDVIERAQNSLIPSILFVDEIHRFNKSQQDALLGAVEKGTIYLIGATTENPSFEVNSALLSRCRVYVLEHLKVEELMALAQQALQNDQGIKSKIKTIKEYEALIELSGGDARKLLNTLEFVAYNSDGYALEITNTMVMQTVQKNMAIYDKSGEQHYDIISAFIKSIRGNDPNGALYWMARMIHGGEDVKFIARRMLILASEDIGNANPNALLLANACFDAVQKIGWPESRIILSQCAIYLASSPKSNAAYLAIDEALALAEQSAHLTVPLHLRNAPTKLMKDLNYGKEYKYTHAMSSEEAIQEYLPEQLTGTKLYDPLKNKKEEEMRQYLKFFWKEKYQY